MSFRDNDTILRMIRFRVLDKIKSQGTFMVSKLPPLLLDGNFEIKQHLQVLVEIHYQNLIQDVVELTF